MPEGQGALLRLMSWLSPAFPVGAFAYSHGLERAIHDGLIRDRETLLDWLTDLIERGSGWNDAVLLAEAWRSAGDSLPFFASPGSSATETLGGQQANCLTEAAPAEIGELAEAMAGSRERHMETTLQGGAFGEAVAAWGETASPSPLRGGVRGGGKPDTSARSFESSPPPLTPPLKGEGDQIPYPVAVGLAAASHGIELQSVLTAYIHAFASNLIQASVRLVPLGQRDGVATLAALEPTIIDTAARAAGSTLDDLGSCTIMSDIMAMRHEAQYSRVFRS